MLNPFRNIAINLHAAGPIAAVCVWFICIAAVAIFAPHENAKTGFDILSMGGVTLTLALSQRPKPRHEDADGKGSQG